LLQYAEVSGIVVARAAVATFARAERSVFERPESAENGNPSDAVIAVEKTHGQGDCPYASGLSS
jgi:hypothetical protein